MTLQLCLIPVCSLSGYFQQSIRETLLISKRDHVTLLFKTFWEFPISSQHESKIPPNEPQSPTIPTLLLPPSTPAILGHSQTLKPAQISPSLPFLLSAWAPLPPDFHPGASPSSPAWLYSNVTFSVRHFQAVKIYSYSLHNKTSSPFLLFLPMLLLHKQSIFPPSRRNLNHSEKSHFVTLGLLPFHRDYTKFEAWLFLHFPGNRALNHSNGLKLKILICLNEAHFPTPSLKEKNLSWCCQDTTFCNSETNARRMLSFFSFSPLWFFFLIVFNSTFVT